MLEFNIYEPLNLDATPVVINIKEHNEDDQEEEEKTGEGKLISLMT